MPVSKSKRTLSLLSLPPAKSFLLQFEGVPDLETHFIQTEGWNWTSLCGTGGETGENARQESFLWPLPPEFPPVGDSLWVCCWLESYFFANFQGPLSFHIFCLKQTKNPTPNPPSDSHPSRHTNIWRVAERCCLENRAEWTKHSVVNNTKPQPLISDILKSYNQPG